MAYANDVPDITQTELQQLVRHDTTHIGKAEQAVVRKDCMQTHCPRVQDAFVAKIRQTGMSVDNLHLFADEDLSQYREGREHGGKGRRAIHHPVRKMIDLQSVRQVSYSGSTWVWRAIGVRDYYYVVPTVN